jgi:hypothetical protein
MSTAPYPEAMMDDNKPVPPKDPAGSAPEPTTLSSFERAAMEMAQRPAPPPDKPKPQPKPEIKTESKLEPAAKPAGPTAPINLTRPAGAFKMVEQYDVSSLPFTSTPIAVTAAPSQPAPATTASASPPLRPMFDDTFRLTLTSWQSGIAAVAILLFVIGACGMAAYSWTVAYNWGCRVGLVENYCPPLPPKPLPKPEIPA